MAMFKLSNPEGRFSSAALLICRLVAGGAFVLSSATKLRAGPKLFAMSIESFKLTPAPLVDPIAFYLPWFELTVGLALVLGIWGRQAAVLAGALYAVFTVALASVLLRGMAVDCGCFGDLFGTGAVSWPSIIRNLILIGFAAAVIVYGGGAYSLDGRRRGLGIRKQDTGIGTENREP